MCSDSPDMTAMNTAAAASAALGQEALAWYKQQYADSAPARADAAAAAKQVSAGQIKAADLSTAMAADYDKYNKETFRPLEQGIVADAQAYDTPEKRQAAADAAIADTNMAFDATNQARSRQLAANGVNPGDARSMAIMEGQGVSQAVANAGAAYKARKGVETVGHGMKMDAASLGRGLASSQATAAQVAMQQGNSGVANAGIPLAQGNQATTTTAQGFNAAMQGQQVAGNLYGQAANIQNQSGDDALWGAVGKLGGAAIMASDEKLKTDIETASDEEALEATKATPVKKWRYDPAKMASAGIQIPPGSEGENIGPMAQDVNEEMGDEAAPGGKQINLVTMNGITMKAVQALDKKVNKLAQMIGAGNLQAGAQA